jgi:putative toxin-antitoxin system antitoxin component (TIGR02293 family)
MLPTILWHHVPMSPVARKLSDYLEEWLGTKTSSEQQIVRLVEAGLPTKIVNRLVQRGLSRDEVFSLIVNPRTLKHRRSKNQNLSKEESERAVRTVRILALAQSIMGSQEKAIAWLRTAKRRFEGRTPLEMLTTEPGGRLVEQMLIQIDEGMFA